MMKLISLESCSFGTLSITSPITFAPGLNVCTAPNQAGKSTLLTLIDWILYGVPPKGTRRDQLLVERWRPWQGGDPRVAAILAPEHPGWPERVSFGVEFIEFKPHLRDADTLAELTGDEYIRIDGNGTWDLGKRLTGLQRGAFSASLLARQEEMDSVLREESLRRLLTADLAGLVENPERATLDEALRELAKPKFTMPSLAVGEVQLEYLVRKAKEEWQLAKGTLETEQERAQDIAELLSRRGDAELALRSLQEHIDSLVEEGARLELAVAHYYTERQTRLEEQATQWQHRLEQEPWLAEFPAEKEREIEGWLADRRHLTDQRAKAEGWTRDAESLKLRAPYVDNVDPDLAPELAVWAERVGKARKEIDQANQKLKRSQGMLQDLDARIKRSEKIADQLPSLGEMGELQSAMAAAQADWDTADASVTEYGVGTEATQRERLTQLEQVIAPHEAYRVQVVEHIGKGTRLTESRRELESAQELLQAKTKAGGQPLLGSGALLALLGILAGVFGGAVLTPGWLSYVLGAVLCIVGVWLLVAGMKRSQTAGGARIELAKVVAPKLEELATAEDTIANDATALREKHGISAETWSELVQALPEYQRLSFELLNYHDALRQRTAAGKRLASSWTRLSELCGDTPGEPDPQWLAARIKQLQQLNEHRQQRQDEHAKLRDTETVLERMRGEEDEALKLLRNELEPLALGELLEKDVTRALREFNKMCENTKRYRELSDKAREAARLETQERDLTEKLGRLLAPLGLGEMAIADADSALREFVKLREDAQNYANLSRKQEEVAEQIRHLPVSVEDYRRRWQTLPQETRDELAAMATDDAGCDDLLQRRHNLSDNMKRTLRELESRREEANKLRVQAAKDEDAEDQLRNAVEMHEAAQTQLGAVSTWQRALAHLQHTLANLAEELASNLAPKLTEELDRILEQAPVKHVRRTGFSPSLELLLEVDDAPPGLAGEELLNRLSVGARRQLSLAVRMAVARSLGEDQYPLLLLDEPLAELDDAHAQACLGYIAQLAAEHQVLLTTCHEQQYAWLSKQVGLSPSIISLPG
jgi:DNA repair exonuclease SbcCD ATPase subunit